MVNCTTKNSRREADNLHASWGDSQDASGCQMARKTRHKARAVVLQKSLCPPNIKNETATNAVRSTSHCSHPKTPALDA